ncbi:MAG TPA: hypothetical protein VKS60_09705 [Stellaceae bacterium]|nr:hypothetical protein [Stellaceae bacterium]
MSTKDLPSWDEELPVTGIPAIPAWSENYCFDGYDPVNEAGCWLHLGRWPRNASIWREQVLLYLPRGDHLVIRGFGNHPVERGAGGALLKLQCLEPGSKWRLTYSGPARRLTVEQMMAGPHTHLSEGPYVTVDMDLTFVATRRPWDFGELIGENWATFHYEQHGRLTGRIRYDAPGGGERTVEMDGNAYRDHSRGPRELSNFGGFYWLHGQFPGGRAFSMVRSYKFENGVRSVGVARAVVFDGDRILPATAGELPILTDKNLPPETYAFELESELGTMAIEARLLRVIAQSSDRYMDQYDGIATSEIGTHYCFEQPTEFRWNGLTGHGWTERAERA